MTKTQAGILRRAIQSGADGFRKACKDHGPDAPERDKVSDEMVEAWRENAAFLDGIAKIIKSAGG